MQEILENVPGYTGGMFSKNVDAVGQFEPDQESDLADKKKYQYHKVKVKAYKMDAENSAEQAAKAGQQPSFENRPRPTT